ncbi:DUF3626 domain-containing protein [Actinoplanes sp. NPDC049599]|uniref:DUF3626 domain-containing protein n=1 Tax=Actinoplanes sp. NPDC049599 TaxID=3363903 RepID=UPI0037985753
MKRKRRRSDGQQVSGGHEGHQTRPAIKTQRAGAPERRAPWLTEPSPSGGAVELDDYVEAQLHGGLDLAADVEAVVADPCFAGTPTAAQLAAIAPLRYHPGFVLAADAFPAELRGLPQRQDRSRPGGRVQASSESSSC